MEGAQKQIEEANESIIDAEALIIERDVDALEQNGRIGNVAFFKGNSARTLLSRAKAHLENALNAFQEQVYGRAFGQAVSANQLARNAKKMAEHENRFKDDPSEAEEKIDAARDEIKEAEEELEGFEGNSAAASDALKNALEHLERAVDAFENGNFGAAYAHARAAKRLAENSEETTKYIKKRSRRSLNLGGQGRNGRQKFEDSESDEDDEVE
jgi:chromosome segregation ATPase